MSKYSLLFQKTGTNSFGAATGDLILFEKHTEILRVSVFSGGTIAIGSNPIPKGTFTIRLDIRGTATSKSTKKDDGGIPLLKPFYGIQEIPPNIDGFDHQWEWGSIRACLNETHGETDQAFRGNYLHGKHRPDDYTHGCICDRSEVLLRKLQSISGKDATSVRVTVDS